MKIKEKRINASKQNLVTQKEVKKKNSVTNRKGGLKTSFKYVLEIRKLPKSPKMVWEWLGKLKSINEK